MANLNDIYAIFMKYKDVFPYIRKDYLQREMDKGNLRYSQGVVLIVKCYKKSVTIGTCTIPSGHYMISEIASNSPGNGMSSRVLKSFLNEVSTSVWTTVREDNDRAVQFYYKMGFIQKGVVYWKDKTIKGLILIYRKPNDFW